MPAAERKLVSLLFIDLSGYTALTASKDPEDVADIVGPLLADLAGLVESYGGVVPSMEGDGFMALFGVPAAHEDDAVRAVRAALACVAHAEPDDCPLKVHAGVEAGEVLIAARPGGRGSAYTGDAVNLASRLCDLARSGQVFVGPAAYALACTEVPHGPPADRRVRGLAQRLPVRQALPGPVGAAPEQRAADRRRFVGRRAELEVLTEALDEVVAGSGSQVVEVRGEAGIGKTRLVEELLASRPGMRVLTARCSSYPGGLPFLALTRALVRELGSAAAVADAAGVGDLGLRATLERLAGEPGPADLPTVPEGPGAGDVLVNAIVGLARRDPVVVVVDNADAADPDLAALLTTLPGPSQPAKVLWVLVGRALPPLSGSGAVLGPLPTAEWRELLADLLGAPPAASLVRALAARGGGNPLLLTETVRALRDRGALERGGGPGEEVVLRDPDALAEVPATLRGLFASRLDGFPREEKELLQDISVTGGVAWPELLGRLRPERDTARLAPSLAERGVLVASPSPRVPTEAEFRAQPPLLLDVAYVSVPRRARAEIHLAVARWLRELESRGHGWTASVAELAHHEEHAFLLGSGAGGGAARAVVGADAVRSLVALARQVMFLQPRAAAAVCRRADRLLDAGASVEPEVRAEVALLLARAMVESWEHTGAIAAADRALACAPDAPTVRGGALLARGSAYSALGQLDAARADLAAARQAFAASGDLRGEAQAVQAAAKTWRFSDMARLVTELEQAYLLLASAGDRRGAGVLAAELAYALTERGGEEFRGWHTEARRLLDDEQDLRSRAYLARVRGMASLLAGRFTDTVEAFKEAGELAVEAGARWVEADALIGRAEALANLGRRAEAFRLLDRVFAQDGGGQWKRWQAAACLLASSLERAEGNLGAARDRLEAGRSLVLDLGGVSDLDSVTEAELFLALHIGAGEPGLDTDVRGVLAELALAGRDLVAVPLRSAHARRMLLTDPAAALPELREVRTLARRSGADGHLVVVELALGQAEMLVRRRPPAAGVPSQPPPVEEAGSADADGGDTPVRRALAAELAALRALADGRAAGALAALDTACAEWVTVGASVWAARSAAWRGAVARLVGDTAAADAATAAADHECARVGSPLTPSALVAPLAASGLLGPAGHGGGGGPAHPAAGRAGPTAAGMR